MELSTNELQVLLQRHPEVRVSMIPLDKGVVLEDIFLVTADKEGVVRGYNLGLMNDIFDDLQFWRENIFG